MRLPYCILLCVWKGCGCDGELYYSRTPPLYDDRLWPGNFHATRAVLGLSRPSRSVANTKAAAVLLHLCWFVTVCIGERQCRIDFLGLVRQTRGLCGGGREAGRKLGEAGHRPGGWSRMAAAECLNNLSCRSSSGFSGLLLPLGVFNAWHACGPTPTRVSMQLVVLWLVPCFGLGC